MMTGIVFEPRTNTTSSQTHPGRLSVKALWTAALRFHDRHRPVGILDLEQEHSSLLTGRTVDLVTKRAPNRWIKDRVLSEAKVLYDAA